MTELRPFDLVSGQIFRTMIEMIMDGTSAMTMIQMRMIQVIKGIKTMQMKPLFSQGQRLLLVLVAVLMAFGPGVTEAQDKKAAAPPPTAQADPQSAAQSVVFDPSQTRIAVIDIQKILRESKSAISLREQLDEIRRTERDQIVKKEDALGDQQQDLNRQRNILSAEAYERKLRELERKAATLNRELEGRKQQIDIAFERSLAVIRTNLVAVVREIAQANGVNVVLAKSQVLLVGAELEITDESLRRLDKKLPKVSLEIPNPVTNQGTR